jgi:putative endonuclease
MRDADTVVFVEVRYRRDDLFGGGAGSVDARKRRRIVLAARAWLAKQRGMGDAPCRFDVVTVQGADGRLECKWIRAAFTLDDA